MRTMTLALITALALVAATAAVAQSRVACKDEIAKFCANVPAGGGRIAQCLHGHDAELSPTCKTALAQLKDTGGRAGRGADIISSCQGDMHKFCADVQQGEGRIMKCLHEHHSELSPGCQQALPAPKPTPKS